MLPFVALVLAFRDVFFELNQRYFFLKLEYWVLVLFLLFCDSSLPSLTLSLLVLILTKTPFD